MVPAEGLEGCSCVLAWCQNSQPSKTEVEARWFNYLSCETRLLEEAIEVSRATAVYEPC